MKLVIIGMLLMLFCQKLSAQTNVGFIAGGLNAHHTDKIDHFKKSNDYGVSAGLLCEQQITRHASLELNALFSYTKNIVESDSSYIIINPYYHNYGGVKVIYAQYETYGVSLPLLLKYRISFFNDSGLKNYR